MIIIIDAYNVLKQVSRTTFVEKKERTAFLKKLADYAHQKHHTIIVVFDAGEYDRTTQRNYQGITVMYSGAHASADDVIKKLFMNYPPTTIVLVSSDRELCAYAGNFGIVSIDSHEFYRLLDQKDTAPRVTVVKSLNVPKKRAGHISSPATDTLMQEASSVIMYKDEQEAPIKKSVGKVLSKKEKKMLTVVKKL